MTTSVTEAPSSRVLLAEDLSCPPRFATPRTPERKTLGGAVSICADLLGLPLMEWQRYVLDVLLEIDPETGELAYTDWLLTVPRQSGKSTLILAKSTHRATDVRFFGRRQNIKYAAQSRVKAKEKFEEDYVGQLAERPRFASMFSQRSQNSSEQIVWIKTKSRFSIESGTKKAGHGSTVDEAYVDEAFAQPDGRLEEAFEPAMSTRLNAQLGHISTMGWRDTSKFFNAKVAAGRKLAAIQMIDVGARRGTAVFEWSAPDDADPGAIATWLAAMPALHRPGCDVRTCKAHTQRIATIQGVYDKAVREKKLPGFRRAYLNQSVDEPKVIESETLPNWSACGLTLDQIDGDVPAPVAIGIAVAAKGAWASIGAAGWWEDRTVHVGPVDRRRGTEWVVAEALRIQIDHDCAVVIREDCPDAELPDALEAAGVVLTRLTGKEWATSCSMLRNRVERMTLTHLHDPLLDGAVVASTWKTSGTREVLDIKTGGEASMVHAVAGALHACDREADPSIYVL